MHPTLSIDIGTTSVKARVLDEAGKTKAASTRTTPTSSDGTGETYDVVALIAFVTKFLAGLDAGVRASVRRIAISGVSGSGGCVAPDGTLVSPMVVWHDLRGAGLLRELTPDESSRLHRITGLSPSATHSLTKLMWVLRHGATITREARWLNVEEYLATWLTGDRWTEYSLASRTLALDLERREWSREACGVLGVDPGVLPPLRAATEGTTIRADRARSLGLRGETRVHVAGHDHMVGGVGADLAPGEMLNSTGTTEVLLSLHDRLVLDKDSELAKLAHGVTPSGGAYTLLASIPTGGALFAALGSLLGVSAAELTARLDSIHQRYLSGAIDLDDMPLVLPYFRGSPPPMKDPTARGTITGIRLDTSADDIIFGCFLGLVRQLQDVLELVGPRPGRMKVIGPGGKNALWSQLKADALGIPLSTVAESDIVAAGGQAIASKARGRWSSAAPVDVFPDPARTARLEGWRDRTGRAWEHAKGVS